MNKEQKELLLKDLCARLPYEVKVQSYSYEDDVETIETLYEIDSDGYMATLECETLKCITKPYLFPLSSMTEEQKQEFIKISGCETQQNEYCGFNSSGNYVVTIGDYEYDYDDDINIDNFYPNFEIFDWLNKNHFDYRGLIEKGLAIDATNLNIY